MRSYVDNRYIDQMIQDGILDEELTIRYSGSWFYHSCYSHTRASLVEVLNALWVINDFGEKLVKNLSKPANDPAAAGIIKNVQSCENRCFSQTETVVIWIPVLKW